MTCENRNVTIIGGTRGLGNWIAELFKENEYNVTITSRNKVSGEKIAEKMGVNYSDDNISAIKNAKIIIFSVPIEYMVETIKEVAPHAKKDSIIIDVTSIKTEPSKALLKYAPKDTEILPCHPMFGPRPPSLYGQVVILTPIEGRCEKSYGKVLEFLNKYHTKIVESTPEEHDKIMSVVQGLTHFSFISIASTIRKLEISVKKSRQFASPIYSLMLDMISRIVSQNPYLYYSIQKSNYQTEISRNMLINENYRLAKLIDEGKKEEFAQNMNDTAKHLNEFEEALGRSDKAISFLTQDLNILKESIGKEIGVKHQYSKKIHVGILESMTNYEIVLKDLNDKKTTLKISNINILPDSEVYEWKKHNSKIYHYDVTAMFLETCKLEILLDSFKKIEEVIDVHIKEIYTGPQVKEGYMSLSFHYTVFNKEDKETVENYLIGLGGTIR